MSWFGFVLTLISASLSAAGNLLMRHAMLQIGNIQLDEKSFYAILGSRPLLTGVALYFVAIPLWLKVLTKDPISTAQPVFSGVLFCFILIGANYFTSEPVGLQKILGAVVILIGIAIAVRA